MIITHPKADPHWSESARELIAGMIAAVVERQPGVASFRDVRTLLTAPVDFLAGCLQRIVEENPNSLAGRKLRRFVENNNKEIQSIRNSGATQTAILDSARLLESMESGPDTLDLRDLARGRVTVYVVLPVERLLTYGRWMRLIVQLALQAISSADTPPNPPVLFLLDELGTINPGNGLKSIEQAYGLLGGMGIRVWGIFQSLQQLQNDYPSSWQNMIANCETIQLMTVNDDLTAGYFSNALGTRTVTETQPGGQTVRFPRPVMLPQELKHLPADEIIVLRKGGNALRLRSLPYFKNPLFAGLYRPNPLYVPAAEVRAELERMGALFKPPAPPLALPAPPAALSGPAGTGLTLDLSWMGADAPVFTPAVMPPRQPPPSPPAPPRAAELVSKATGWIGSMLRRTS